MSLIPLSVQRKGGAIALATILLLTAAFRGHLDRLENVSESDIALERLPMELGEWQGKETEGLDVRSQEILQLDRYVKRYYQNPEGEAVLLYVGYWKKQSGEYQAAKHSPELCLPSNGWQIQRQGQRSFAFNQDGREFPIGVKRIVGEVGGRAHLFYYWFFTGEANYVEEWRALLTISLQKFLAGRSDGGIVEISTPISGSANRAEAIEVASKRIEGFLEEFYPALREIVRSPAEDRPLEDS